MSKQTQAAALEYVKSHGFQPTKLYCLRRPAPKRVRILGEQQWIEYTTRKDFEGDETFIFHHDFEGEKKPFIAYGHGSWVVVGGGYTVTPHGIEDDPQDERELPDVPQFLADLSTPESVTGMGVMYAVGYNDGTKIRTVDFSKKSKPPILSYNHEGEPKQLYIVPVSQAQVMRIR